MMVSERALEMSGNWHDLMAAAAFPEEGKLAVQINGWHVLVARTEGGLFAVNDSCTHQAALLSGGKIRRGAIMCPLHGARFDLATGKCLGGGYADLRRFEVRIENGMIAICIPANQPGLTDMPVMI